MAAVSRPGSKHHKKHSSPNEQCRTCFTERRSGCLAEGPASRDSPVLGSRTPKQTLAAHSTWRHVVPVPSWSVHIEGSICSKWYSISHLHEYVSGFPCRWLVYFFSVPHDCGVSHLSESVLACPPRRGNRQKFWLYTGPLVEELIG